MILASAVEHRCGGVEKEIKVACVVVLIGDRYRSRFVAGIAAAGFGFGIKAGQFDGDGSGGLSIEEDIKRCGASLFCGEEMAVIASAAGLVEGDAWRGGSDGWCWSGCRCRRRAGRR